MDEVIKTIGIKLDMTPEQIDEANQLFEAFRVGINWSLKEIEKRYQLFLSTYEEINRDVTQKSRDVTTDVTTKPLKSRDVRNSKDVTYKPEQRTVLTGICAGCNTEKTLKYIHKETGNKYCTSCGMKTYSQYTIRKEIYGAGDRVVENDLKTIVEIPTKTHYDSLFAQSYAMWTSYNGWRNKRQRQIKLLEDELSNSDRIFLNAANLIEKKAVDLKRNNPKLIWKTVKTLVTKEVYRDFSDKEREQIAQLHNKVITLQKLKKPVHFPELKKCNTVMMDKGFVRWKDDKMYMTLFNKGKSEMKYFGKNYIAKFIPSMEDDMSRSNLTIKNGEYYIMYPLSIKIRQPPDIKECDTYVAMFSPTKTAIVGYDMDGVVNSVKFFETGKLVFAKRHFKDKRTEIATRKYPEEKMRNIRRRKKKIKVRGNIEHRFVSTFNHQVTRKMIDYIMEQSENPKLLIWDMGNGISQNFGRDLNYRKNLFPVVQQQEYLKHKALQVSMPVIEIQYNKCNDLICSNCGEKQVQNNGGKINKKPMKVITQLIKGIKNFKCEKCGYEVNMLINQTNNIKDKYQSESSKPK